VVSRYCQHCFTIWGRDSLVGIATRYGPDGLGSRIPVRGGAIFSAPVQTRPGAHPASYTVGTGSFLGEKRPACGADVEGRVELYICSPSWLSWPVLGLTLHINFKSNFYLFLIQKNWYMIHNISFINPYKFY